MQLGTPPFTFSDYDDRASIEHTLRFDTRDLIDAKALLAEL